MSRVSVIIPVFNRPAMLVEAVDSVLRQTYTDSEIIIVDDGSTDDTAATAHVLVERHAPRIEYACQPNSGPGVARNIGLAAAHGEFIQFLDSDDLLEPEKFARQVALLDAHPECGVCYCTTVRGASLATSRPTARSAETFDRILPEFLLDRGWPTIAPLWRRSACEAIGPWSPLRVMEDWEFDCRAGLAGIRPIHCPEVLARMRDHGEQRAGLGLADFDDARVANYFDAHRTVALGVLQSDLTDRSAGAGFARKLFFISRFCARRGLTHQAQQASDLALRLMPPGAWAVDQRIVRGLARLLGWRAAVRLVEPLRAGVVWPRAARPPSPSANQ